MDIIRYVLIIHSYILLINLRTRILFWFNKWISWTQITQNLPYYQLESEIYIISNFRHFILSKWILHLHNYKGSIKHNLIHLDYVLGWCQLTQKEKFSRTYHFLDSKMDQSERSRGGDDFDPFMVKRVDSVYTL